MSGPDDEFWKKLRNEARPVPGTVDDQDASTCWRCKAWEQHPPPENDKNMTMGECRRHAPTTHMGWPQTYYHHWCLDFIRRSE